MAEPASSVEARMLDPEQITKAAAASALLLYVVGLVAVNEYLAPYGASDFALLRARFVYTGALVLTPLLITAIVVTLVRLVLDSQDGDDWYKRGGAWIKLVWLSALLLAGVWTTFRWAIASLGHESSRHANLHALTLLAAALVLVLLIRTALSLKQWHAAQRAKLVSVASPDKFMAGVLGPAAFFYILIAGVVTVLAFAFYLGKVVDDVYPIVPEQFGGGRPVLVSMSLTAQGVAALHQLEPGVDQTSYQSVQLLFEGRRLLSVPAPSERRCSRYASRLSDAEEPSGGRGDSDMKRSVCLCEEAQTAN